MKRIYTPESQIIYDSELSVEENLISVSEVLSGLLKEIRRKELINDPHGLNLTTAYK